MARLALDYEAVCSKEARALEDIGRARNAVMELLAIKQSNPAFGEDSYETMLCDARRRVDEKCEAYEKVRSECKIVKQCCRNGCTNDWKSHCARCGNVSYCSRECQRADWRKRHRDHCVALPPRPQEEQNRVERTCAPSNVMYFVKENRLADIHHMSGVCDVMRCRISDSMIYD